MPVPCYSSRIFFLVLMSIPSIYGCSSSVADYDQGSKNCCPPMLRVKSPHLVKFHALVQPQNYVPILKNTRQTAGGKRLNLTICLPYDGSKVHITITRRHLDYIDIFYPPGAPPDGTAAIPEYEGEIIGQQGSHVRGTLYDGIFIGSIHFNEEYCRQEFSLRSVDHLNLTATEFAELKSKVGGHGFHSIAIFYHLLDWYKCDILFN